YRSRPRWRAPRRVCGRPSRAGPERRGRLGAPSPGTHGGSNRGDFLLLFALNLAQLVEALEVVEEQDAVQVVDLVLKRLAEQAVAFDAELGALPVAGLHCDRPGPLHRGVVARHRQAAFVRLPLAARLHDLRVAEHDRLPGAWVVV